MVLMYGQQTSVASRITVADSDVGFWHEQGPARFQLAGQRAAGHFPRLCPCGSDE